MALCHPESYLRPEIPHGVTKKAAGLLLGSLTACEKGSQDPQTQNNPTIFQNSTQRRRNRDVTRIMGSVLV